jgi:hypothetical protein
LVALRSLLFHAIPPDVHKVYIFQWCKIWKGKKTGARPPPTPTPDFAPEFNKHFYVEIVGVKLFCFLNNFDSAKSFYSLFFDWNFLLGIPNFAKTAKQVSSRFSFTSKLHKNYSQLTCIQGCQMVYYHTKPPALVHFGRPLNGKFRYLLWPFWYT